MPEARRPPHVELAPVTAADEWLTVEMESDPRVMAELGGAWPEEQARATHARRLKHVAEHDSWWLKIVPDDDPRPVGSLVLWHSEWNGLPISEIGWMVLFEHQGKGYASAGLRLILERAREDGRWGDIHAFPGASNGPSNALCRKFGFELVGTGDADYAGRHFPVNHWALRST
jgi:RimJ/RimL family protein N-acetyltransferase